jgi:translocation and assembly module TamB
MHCSRMESLHRSTKNSASTRSCAIANGGSVCVDGLIGIRREALGVHTFDISGSGGDDTTASAGKYISDNVFLEVQQGVTSGSAKATLEVELTPSLSAETQIGQQGTSSRLNWTYDY